LGEEDEAFAEFAAQLEAQPEEAVEQQIETVESQAEVVEEIPEPSQPQSEMDWLREEEPESVAAQAEEDISAAEWLTRMADDSEETMKSPQVMMEEQTGEQPPAVEPEAAQAAASEEHEPQPVEPAPQPVAPTAELAEEITAEVNDFWAAEDEPEDVEPEPIAAEPAAPETPDTAKAGSPLDTAHLGLDHGDIEGAVAIYEDLIQESKELDGIIAKLTQVLAEDPNQALLWQTLGDAYMNNDQLNEAIQAYQKGTEVA
jgi:tetratricopeptide (TPR) repeat protein